MHIQIIIIPKNRCYIILPNYMGGHNTEWLPKSESANKEFHNMQCLG